MAGGGSIRRVDCGGPGIARVRKGRGFAYLDPKGRPLRDPEALARISQLAIPPAWRDVWICPVAEGHLQAVGVDAAGRRQYRYHDRWRARRDAAKFNHVLEFARVLPALRERVAEHLALAGLPRERVLAVAVRLLDRGFFRVGSDGYALHNHSFGVATLRREHATVRAGRIRFDYPSKSGRRRVVEVADADAARVVAALKRRRGGGLRLLAGVRSEDVNGYLREQTGGDFTAKDFRTWSATVLAAVALSASWPVADSRTARNRAISRAISEVAHYLGNTPAVCRAAYVDPRVIDRYRHGLTIAAALERLGEDPDGPSYQGAVERAVLELISDHHAPELELATG